MTDTPLRAGAYARQSRGNEKSISDQAAANRLAADRQGWQLVAEYADGTSASRFARSARDEWTRVLADIGAGRLDVLILWESSRGDRTPETWFQFLTLCRTRSALIHVVSHERTYDLRRPRDWRTLAEDGIDNAYESEKIAVRVRRGHAAAAEQGRPSHGRTPYGYRRTYDPRTGALVGQEPDPDTAPIVREIITSIADGAPIRSVQVRLIERGVPPVGARQWYHRRVRDIALNPAYAGMRQYNGQLYPASWPALVDPEVWHRAQRVLSDPSRVTTRPGRQVHLLSYLATCGHCEAVLCAVRGKYRCSRTGCVTIVQAETDHLVEQVLLERLTRTDAYESMRSDQDAGDAESAAAEAEVEQLQGQLEQWRASAIAGDTTPASLAVIERGLLAKIRSAEGRARQLSVHPALRQLLEPGADVRVRWEAMGVPAQRDVIRAVAQVVACRAESPGGRPFNPARLGRSRWVGDDLTWADHWAADAAQAPFI